VLEGWAGHMVSKRLEFELFASLFDIYPQAFLYSRMHRGLVETFIR